MSSASGSVLRFTTLWFVSSAFTAHKITHDLTWCIPHVFRDRAVFLRKADDCVFIFSRLAYINRVANFLHVLCIIGCFRLMLVEFPENRVRVSCWLRGGSIQLDDGS